MGPSSCCQVDSSEHTVTLDPGLHIFMHVKARNDPTGTVDHSSVTSSCPNETYLTAASIKKGFADSPFN